MLPWQRRFLRGAFLEPGDAGLSVARGNGKSALCAAIACAAVDPVGPLTGSRRELVVVVAASFDQSRIIFEDVLAQTSAHRYDLSDRATWIGGKTARNRATAGVSGDRGAGAVPTVCMPREVQPDGGWAGVGHGTERSAWVPW